MGQFGADGLIFIFLIALLMLGPRSPRQLAESFQRAMEELRQQLSGGYRSRPVYQIPFAAFAIHGILGMVFVFEVLWLAQLLS